MTIPRKHHYVPRVHIRKFKSNGCYTVYLKNQDKITKPISSSDIFAIKDLNSTIDPATGIVDHGSIENELDKKWDTNFNYHYDFLIAWVLESIKTNQFPDRSIDQPLAYFFEYAIVGKLRSMNRLKHIQQQSMETLANVPKGGAVLTNIIEEHNYKIPGFTNQQVIETIQWIENSLSKFSDIKTIEISVYYAYRSFNSCSCINYM